MIKIVDLNKTYLTKKKIETIALENINLELNNNGLVFITGRTGCGKSTLLNILGRLDKETSGSIIIDNKDITKLNQKEVENYRNNEVGFIFQEYNLIDEFSVYENIALVYKLKQEKVNEEEIKKLLERFGLSEKINKRCDELSGGERQRVAIIRALIKKPKIILADEPTGALDEITGKEIIETLKEISKETLVIVVTHDEEYPEKYGDRIIELEDGKIIKDIIKIKLEEKNETKEIKKYNSKLSYKDIFKLSLSTIKKRILRLTLMAIVMIASLTIIGTLSTYANYNKEKMIYESTLKGGDKHILVGSRLDIGSTNNFTRLNDEDKEYLEKKYGQKFYPYYKNLKVNFSFNFSKYDGNPSINFYRPLTCGSMEINEEIAKDLGFKLYVGRFPTNDNEVVITDYHFILFRDFGYCKNIETKDEKAEIKKYSDLIGKTINNNKFKIVGVLNTNFDEKRYDVLKQYNTEMLIEDKEIRALDSEMQLMVRESITNCVFYNTGYISKYFEENNCENYYGVLTIEPDMKLSSTNISSTNKIMSLIYIGNSKVCPEEVIYKEGYNKEKLADDEIIINWKILSMSYQINNYNLISEVTTRRINYQYSLAGRKLFEKILEESGYNDNKITYEECLELYKWEIENIVLEEIFNETIFKDLDDILLYVDDSNIGRLFEKKIKVVGIINYNPLKEVSRELNYFFSDNLYDEIIKVTESYDYRGFFTSLDSKSLKLLEDLTDLEKSFLEERYRAYSKYVTHSARVNNYLRKTSKLGLKIEIVLIIFSILLFGTYIDFIVKDRKKEIGVLLSLGTRKKDIKKIFINVSLIISLFVFGISIIGTIILTNIINSQIKKLCSVILEILTVDILTILLVLVLSIVVTLIITFITVNHTTRKKPIDIMKIERD